MRLPDGRESTLEYINKLNNREVFPAGTQFALIDHAFLISDRGELVLSPFINSIPLRAYFHRTGTGFAIVDGVVGKNPSIRCTLWHFVTRPCTAAQLGATP